MDSEVFEKLEAKYASHASWAIWNPDNLVDTNVIRANLETLKTSVVMVALNISGVLPAQWRNFHSRDHARKLMFAFNQSPYRGAYMTDLIKGEVEPSAARLITRIRNQDVDLHLHLEAFRQEMSDVGVNEQALFILFGRAVTKVFKKHLGEIYRNHVSCTHYSMYGIGYTDLEWVTKTWQILEGHYDATAAALNTPQFLISERMKVQMGLRESHATV